MKKVISIIGLMLAVFVSNAQDGSWTIRMNTKLLFSARAENENANSIKIKSSEWRKNGFLEVSYKENDLNTWIRSFLFFDEEDNQLLNKDSTTYSKITMSSLRKAFAGKKEVRIYTIVAPVDPNIAIRIRRVHLCTLKLQ